MSRTLRTCLPPMLLALAVGLSTSPWVQPPGGDRELYRYVGMLLAKGGVPYRDVFDIKPPL
ncbi:MAG TPA: hypothetical protein VFH51_00520, partial [Myxococcota bacterium]|nr:hypothetical protein [Myxococcota bacterium]